MLTKFVGWICTNRTPPSPPPAVLLAVETEEAEEEAEESVFSWVAHSLRWLL